MRKKTIHWLSKLDVHFQLDCFKEIHHNSTAVALWAENVPDHMFDTTTALARRPVTWRPGIFFFLCACPTFLCSHAVGWCCCWGGNLEVWEGIIYCLEILLWSGRRICNRANYIMLIIVLFCFVFLKRSSRCLLHLDLNGRSIYSPIEML